MADKKNKDKEPEKKDSATEALLSALDEIINPQIGTEKFSITSDDGIRHEWKIQYLKNYWSKLFEAALRTTEEVAVTTALESLSGMLPGSRKIDTDQLIHKLYEVREMSSESYPHAVAIIIRSQDAEFKNGSNDTDFTELTAWVDRNATSDELADIVYQMVRKQGVLLSLKKHSLRTVNVLVESTIGTSLTSLGRKLDILQPVSQYLEQIFSMNSTTDKSPSRLPESIKEIGSLQ